MKKKVYKEKCFSLKNQYIGGNCLKRGGALGQFPDLGGGLGKREGGFFLGGGLYPNAHYGKHNLNAPFH